MKEIEQFIDLIKNNNKIVFITEDTLSNQHIKNFMYIFNNKMLKEHTEEFYEYFYRNVNNNVKPNIIHQTIKKLEDKNKVSGIISFSIDGLYKRVKCKHLYEMVGNMNNFVCTKCKKKFTKKYAQVNTFKKCNTCGSIIKPDIVLQDEEINHHLEQKCNKVIKDSNLIVIIGCDLRQYKINSLLKKNRDKTIVVINEHPQGKLKGVNLVIKENPITIFNIINKNIEKEV